MQQNAEPTQPIAIPARKNHSFYDDNHHLNLLHDDIQTQLDELWRNDLGRHIYTKYEGANYFIVDFKAGRKDLFYTQFITTINVGDMVIVEGCLNGQDLGEVSGNTPAEVKEFIFHEVCEGRTVTPKKLFRKARSQHLESLSDKIKKEAEVLKVCQEIARVRTLLIEIVDAEYQWDGQKLWFYFTSEEDSEEILLELQRDVLRQLRNNSLWIRELPSMDLIRIRSRPIQHSAFDDMALMFNPGNPLEQQSITLKPKGVDIQLQIPLKPSGKIPDLIQRVQVTLETKQEYRKLLARRDVHAQGLLDMFQRLLDVLIEAPQSFRRILIVATQRLSAASELYPVCYEMTNVITPELPECSGGSADIYKGDFFSRSVCVKVLRLHKGTQMKHFMKVVSREAILWGQLRHPNLVPFYGIYRYRGRISLIAPWMANGDIEDYLEHQTSSNRVVLAYDVAKGLEFLHENGIIHGDLKGKNILVNDFGRACVADFGLSSISDKKILAWTSLSSAASKGGTLRWQAPELFDLSENGEERRNTMESDMYAWGCVAYEIFAGKFPFSNLIREAAIMKYVSGGGQPIRPRALSNSWILWGLTEEIWTLMQTCWSPQPDARPRVGAVVDHLSSCLPPGVQKTAVVQTLSPGQFREMMRKCSDKTEMTIQTYESLLYG